MKNDRNIYEYYCCSYTIIARLNVAKGLKVLDNI